MRIALCGSTRFMEQYHAWNRWLALQGHTVYSVAQPTTSTGNFDITDDEKETLDLVHLDKILNSEAILVINCLRNPDDYKFTPGMSDEKWALLTEDYIGESTRREIKWAKIKVKRIVYSTTHEPNSFF